jgi:hypothetical protein
VSIGSELDDEDGRQPREEEIKIDPEGQEEHEDAPE